MGLTGPKERATFSLDSGTKQQLDGAVPKSMRSQFVDRAIREALRADALRRAVKAMREFPRVPINDGEGAVEALRRIRAEREDGLDRLHRQRRGPA